MTNQKGIAPIIIVLILAVLIAGGVLAYRYWTAPTPKPGTWSGTIISINVEEKIIEAQGLNQKIRSSVSDKTIIEDKQGTPISLESLKEGDFISISGIYQMAGKMTPEWDVVIVAERIKVLGECIGESEEKTSDIWCCPGLSLLEQKYCTKCGDGICKSPENQENCPLDCTRISEPVSVSIFIDVESFDLDNKTFEGLVYSVGVPPQERERVKVLTTDSTEFYRGAYDGDGEFVIDTYYTFSEFHSLLENWSGPSWPFTVKGILEEESVIKADEVFMIAQ